MPRGIFVVDKMGKGEIHPAQALEKDLQKGIFSTQINGEKIIAQKTSFSNPIEGAYATHVAFRTRAEAAEYKNQIN